MPAARDNFCPACRSSFRTMDGLHSHIDKKHPGKSLRELQREEKRRKWG